MPQLPSVTLAALRKIRPDEVRLLWVNDWYDGPLEAVVEHAGERCLMVLNDRSSLGDEGGPHRWVLIRLTAEQAVDEEWWHALFVQHVGEHWCMHKEPHARVVGPQDPELFHRPLRARPPREYATDEVIGWLDEMPQA